VHAALAEQRVRIGAGTDQVNLGVLAQLRQCRDQEVGALAAPYASGYEQAWAMLRERRPRPLLYRKRERRKSFGPRC
jgi:hypothetical protein